MVEIITHLNKAAYLMIKGNARLRGFEGRYANNCKVVIEIEKEELDRINKEKDWNVDYKKYMMQRYKLKMRIRKIYNNGFLGRG